MSKSERAVALITGASRGLGLAMGQRFSREGFLVVALSRSEPTVRFDDWLPTDLTDAGEREAAIREIRERYGRLDLLINNAGVGMYERWEETSPEDLRQLFEINVFSMISLTQGCLPLLRESRGTIINTASVAGKVPVACMGAYCATKYAVTAFSDTLRIELKPHGVHVMNLIVGRISTGFSEHSLGSMRPASSPELGPKPTPEGLAERVCEAWRRRRRQVTYPRWGALLQPVVRLFPAFWERENLRRWKLD